MKYKYTTHENVNTNKNAYKHFDNEQWQKQGIYVRNARKYLKTTEMMLLNVIFHISHKNKFNANKTYGATYDELLVPLFRM